MNPTQTKNHKTEGQLTRGHSYTTPWIDALTVEIVLGEPGFIARAPALDALGYGDTMKASLADLRDEIRDYLRTLRDEDYELAPSIEHHARYVQLLTVDPAYWFDAVHLPPVLNASDVE